jgi:hypothetical protein
MGRRMRVGDRREGFREGLMGARTIHVYLPEECGALRSRMAGSSAQGGASERRRLSDLMLRAARKRGVSKHAPALGAEGAHGSVLRDRFAAPQDEAIF